MIFPHNGLIVVLQYRHLISILHGTYMKAKWGVLSSILNNVITKEI